jgi:hypothetical protein
VRRITATPSTFGEHAAAELELGLDFEVVLGSLEVVVAAATIEVVLGSLEVVVPAATIEDVLGVASLTEEVCAVAEEVCAAAGEVCELGEQLGEPP